MTSTLETIALVVTLGIAVATTVETTTIESDTTVMCGIENPGQTFPPPPVQ